MPDHALDAERSADSRCGLASQQFDQTVIAPSSPDGVLGSGRAVPDLKHRLAVVVEAADQARVFVYCTSNCARYSSSVAWYFLDSSSMNWSIVGALFSRICVSSSLLSSSRRGLLSRRPAVELGEVALLADEVILDRGHKCLSALGIPDVIELERKAVADTEILQKLHADMDQLRVEGRIFEADHFEIHLMELAVASFLRAVVAEARADGIQFHRLRQLLHTVLDVTSADSGRQLRTKGILHVGFRLFRFMLAGYDE